MEFGELVWALTESHRVKALPAWTCDVWIGRSAVTNEPMVLTGEGLKRTRSIRARVDRTLSP